MRRLLELEEAEEGLVAAAAAPAAAVAVDASSQGEEAVVVAGGGFAGIEAEVEVARREEKEVERVAEDEEGVGTAAEGRRKLEGGTDARLREVRVPDAVRELDLPMSTKDRVAVRARGRCAASSGRE